MLKTSNSFYDYEAKYISDDKGRTIRFVDLDDSFSDSLDEQDWNKQKTFL